MVEIEFRVSTSSSLPYTLIEFELKEPIEPSDLIKLNSRLPRIDSTKGVVISGRGPIWLHSFLAHYYHSTKFVAHYDPRLGGAVITQTHDKKFRIGQVIKVEVKEG